MSDFNIQLNEIAGYDLVSIVKLYREGRSLSRQGAKKTKAAVAVCFESVAFDRNAGLVALAEYAATVDAKNGDHNEISALRMRIREVCEDRKEPVLTVKKVEGQFAVTRAKVASGRKPTKAIENAFKTLAAANEKDEDTLRDFARQNASLIKRLAELV